MRKVFAIAMTLIVIIASGCGQTAKNVTEKTLSVIQFEEKTIARNEHYGRTFKVKYGETDRFNIGFLQGLYDDNELQSVAGKIADDIALIESTLGTSAKHFNIYVLDETITGQPAAIGGNIYCSKDDLYTGLYRVALVEASLGIVQQWQAYGVEGIVFNREADVSALKRYYTDNEDISVLGLFGTRFMSEWNTESDFEIAKETAVSLAEFIVENYGYDILSSDITPQIKNEWLQSIGVDRTFTYEYNDALRGSVVSRLNEDLVLITTQYAIYDLAMVDDYLETSKDIEKFIYRDITGLNFILDYIKEKAPLNYENLRHDAFCKYLLSSERKFRTGDDLHFHLYSTVHELFSSSAPHWQNIGLSEYLSRVICKDSYERERIFRVFKWHAEEAYSGGIDINHNDFIILKYYLDHNGGWETLDDIDMKLYGDACSFGAMYQKDFKCNWSVTPINIRYSTSDKIEGNELSQAQAFSFTSYLIEKYSLEVFLDLYEKDADFEEVFGESYESIKEQWVEYLHR